MLLCFFFPSPCLLKILFARRNETKAKQEAVNDMDSSNFNSKLNLEGTEGL